MHTQTRLDSDQAAYAANETVAYTFRGGRVDLHPAHFAMPPFLTVHEPDGRLLATIPLPAPERLMMVSALSRIEGVHRY